MTMDHDDPTTAATLLLYGLTGLDPGSDRIIFSDASVSFHILAPLDQRFLYNQSHLKRWKVTYLQVFRKTELTGSA
jgi:hypothetical protein